MWYLSNAPTYLAIASQHTWKMEHWRRVRKYIKMAVNGEGCLQHFFRGLNDASVVWPLLGGQPKVLLSILENMSRLTAKGKGNDIHGVNYSLVTCDFAVSGVFAALMIASMFCGTLNRGRTWISSQWCGEQADAQDRKWGVSSLWYMYMFTHADVTMHTHHHLCVHVRTYIHVCTHTLPTSYILHRH